MADAGDLKSPRGNPVRVRIPPPALNEIKGNFGATHNRSGLFEAPDAHD
jgi:hypothetical protein